MEQRRQRYNARMANFFAHLRVHSEYSINDGVGRLGGNIGNIITQAAKNWHTGLGPNRYRQYVRGA